MMNKTRKQQLKDELERELILKERIRISELENRVVTMTDAILANNKLANANSQRVDRLNKSLFSNNISGILVAADVALLTVVGIFAYLKLKK